MTSRAPPVVYGQVILQVSDFIKVSSLKFGFIYLICLFMEMHNALEQAGHVCSAW